MPVKGPACPVIPCRTQDRVSVKPEKEMDTAKHIQAGNGEASKAFSMSSSQVQLDSWVFVKERVPNSWRCWTCCRT